MENNTDFIAFDEEVSLSFPMNKQDKAKLNALFNENDYQSAWNKALRSLNFKDYPKRSLLKWKDGTAFLNIRLLSEILSFGLSSKFSLRSWFKLLVFHFNLEARIDSILRSSLPETNEDKIVESIVLALIIFSLTQRIKNRNASMFSEWMARPSVAPIFFRKDLNHIQNLQLRRTRLSSAWKEIFPDSNNNGALEPTIESSQMEFIGVPVCYGSREDTLIEGIPVIITASSLKSDVKAIREEIKNKPSPRILVFNQAIPETTEVFDLGEGLLFCIGGTLSHACTIARERNIVSLTNLGRPFFTQAAKAKSIQIFTAKNKVVLKT
ncbi:MAG: PEP-utilizing enzyme [Bacteriovoracia bacterium]